jgi:hypothetical protein
MTQDADDSDAVTGELVKPDFASLRGLQVKLRIDEDQARQVQKLAADQRTTISATVRWLIDRGLEADKLSNFNYLVDDLALNWARFGNRFMALALEDDLLKALEERRYDDARAYAVALRKSQAAEAQMRVEKLGS